MLTATIKAVNYLRPYKVRVKEVKKPKLQYLDDIIAKVITVSYLSVDFSRACEEMKRPGRNSRPRSMARTCSKYRRTTRTTRACISLYSSMYEGGIAAEPGITFSKIG